jgi:hypothetical protein
MKRFSKERMYNIFIKDHEWDKFGLIIVIVAGIILLKNNSFSWSLFWVFAFFIWCCYNKPKYNEPPKKQEVRNEV